MLSSRVTAKEILFWIGLKAKLLSPRSQREREKRRKKKNETTSKRERRKKKKGKRKKEEKKKSERKLQIEELTDPCRVRNTLK